LRVVISPNIMIIMSKTKKPNKETLSTIFQSHLVMYQTIFNADQGMDSKNGILIGGVLAFGTFVFQNNIFTRILNICSAANDIPLGFLVFGAVLLISTLIISVIAVWPREYSLPNVTIEEHPEYVVKKPVDVTYQMISDIETAMEITKTRLDLKTKLFTVGLICFMVAAVLLIIIRQSV